jgi:hypothetical protein
MHNNSSTNNTIRHRQRRPTGYKLVSQPKSTKFLALSVAGSAAWPNERFVSWVGAESGSRPRFRSYASIS